MQHHTLDHTEIEKLENLIVECRFTDNRAVIIDKIYILHSIGGFEQDITILMMADQTFMTNLRDILEDWCVDYEYGQLHKPGEFNNDVA
jgi:hypothetical protein